MIPVFDAHCDTPVSLWKNQMSLFSNSGAVSLQRAQKLNGYLQFFSFCTPWLTDAYCCTLRFEKAYSYLMRQLSNHEHEVMLCKSCEDAAYALQSAKTGIFLSVEGAEALGCDAERLEDAYAMGIRMINPVWNTENALCGSCVTGNGFTELGKAFIMRAQELGILLDVSHLSDKGFFELCELTQRPIVASHSNSRAICNHPRNLTDDMFFAICQFGGVCGINLYSDFLCSDGTATMDDVYRHIDYFMERGGDGHVCLGADFDGCERLPDGFTGIDDYTKLYEYLQLRGYSEEVLQRLFYQSLLKVVKL